MKAQKEKRMNVQDQFDNMFSDVRHSMKKLVIAREDLADATVRESDWRGDHCGYLAAQCRARTLRGLTPTSEQVEAWYHDNTNEAKLSVGAI